MPVSYTITTRPTQHFGLLYFQPEEFPAEASPIGANVQAHQQTPGVNVVNNNTGNINPFFIGQVERQTRNEKGEHLHAARPNDDSKDPPALTPGNSITSVDPDDQFNYCDYTMIEPYDLQTGATGGNSQPGQQKKVNKPKKRALAKPQPDTYRPLNSANF